MMDNKLIYVGTDLKFLNTLKQVSNKLALELKNISSHDDEFLVAEIEGIIILDESLLQSEITRLIQTTPQLLQCLIVAVEELSALKTIYKRFPDLKITDIVLKSAPLELLASKLNFLSETLAQIRAAQKQGGKPENNPEKTYFAENNLNLQEKLEQADRHLNIQEKVIERILQISRLSRQINCLDIEKIANVCVEEVPKLISARYTSLYSYDSQKKVLHLLQHNHPYSIARLTILPEHPYSPMTIAVEKKQILLIKDFTEWEQLQERSVNRMFTSNYKSNSCIIAPLMSGDRILGVLNLADKIDSTAFDRRLDLPPVQLICEIIGSAMLNIEMYEEAQKRARTDGLTNLLNHRAFYDLLEKEVSRIKRYGGNISLMMIDLDNLKQINDHYGHLAGDTVLKNIAQKITDCRRGIDVAARYGGDEFAMILPNTDYSEAKHLAKRILKLIATKPIIFEDHTLHATVSIGIGQYRPDITLEEFVNEADIALFEAKSSGKNCFRIFTPKENLVAKGKAL